MKKLWEKKIQPKIKKIFHPLWIQLTANKQTVLLGGIIMLASAWVANKIMFSLDAYITRGDILGGFDHMLDDFDQPLHISINPLDIQISILAALLSLAFYASYRINNSYHRRGEEHGSAKFATTADLAPYVNHEPACNLKFAVGASLSLDTYITRRNLNALILGSSGSGKSRFFVCPNIAQANTSFIVTDPKGELYRKTARFLTTKGYQIRQLNLVDFSASNTVNPLAYINPTQPEVDIMILVENFMTNTSGSKPTSADNGFWEKAERALLSALVSYVFFTQDNPTLNDVVDLLAAMEVSGKDETQESPVDILFQETTKLTTAYYNHTTTDTLIPTANARGTSDTHYEFGPDMATIMSGLAFAASQYRTYLQGAGETKKSVIISLGVRMAPLHMPAIHDLLSTDTLHLDQIGTEKTAIFLIIPDTHATFSFLVSIIYEQIFETNLRVADTRPDGRLKVPIQCFMDEFANIGKMPSFERKIAVMRSRGISVCVIVQTFGQGKALYKDDWETIVGNCDSILFLGGTEKSTTEYISKILGKQTIIADDHSISKGINGSSSTSYRLQARDLLTPDEIGRLPDTHCLYILRGLRPYKGKKLPYPTELAA